ncbi:MAG: hypothetical protein U5O39_01645 [Gammaproteobacteria bacterium]|nr:hypothetical protein [Gammaproteobacteria bacterium]
MQSARHAPTDPQFGIGRIHHRVHIGLVGDIAGFTGDLGHWSSSCTSFGISSPPTLCGPSRHHKLRFFFGRITISSMPMFMGCFAIHYPRFAIVETSRNKPDGPTCLVALPRDTT